MFHNHVVRLVEMLATHCGRSPHTVGRCVSEDGTFYARLKCGRDLTIRRAERVIQQLSDRWPEDLEWPPDIPRPTPTAKPHNRDRAA